MLCRHWKPSCITEGRLSHHCGVPAADQLSHFMKDAFAADAFVQRASFHDDGNGQQDLLTDILLQAEEEQENSLLRLN